MKELVHTAGCGEHLQRVEPGALVAERKRAGFRRIESRLAPEATAPSFADGLIDQVKNDPRDRIRTNLNHL
ncbi:MAG: hypothetical protein GVY14_16255, partial [Spirochaetes bacterium]|nr:hypothetical protein [Spirochaetota bacterium]